MVNNSSMPKIRFEGFNEKWVKKNLVDEIDLYRGLTYSPINIIKNGGTLVLRSSNVKNSELVFTNNVYVNSDIVNSDNVEIGDIIVVVRNGSRSLIGKHAQVKVKMSNTVIGAFMTGMHAKQSSFINALLDTTNFSKEIEKNLGATINQITNGAFQEMIFMFPLNNEQTIIGNYFQKLDNLIGQKEKKHQKLKQFKKAMIDKMFPKNKANTPEVRFEDFSGEWEEKELGDVVEVIMGQSPSSTSYNSNKNGIPLIQGNADIKDRLSSPRNWTTETTKKCEVGNLILTVRAPVGAVAKAIHNACIGRGVCAIRNNIKSSNEFIYQFLLDYETKWSILEQGSTFTAVSGEEIRKIKIKIPNIIEQTKIGNYFQKLDKRINLQNKEIEKLKNIKKASLKKMFV